MTREERVANLKILKSRITVFDEDDDKQLKALQETIKELEQEPCEDAISRRAVLNKIKEVCFSREQEWVDFRVSQGSNGQRDFLINYIEQLPPVTPQPKTGHWYIDERPESDRETICSNCEQPIFKYHKIDFDYRPKFCPNCGAKMIEDTGSEE